MHKQNITQASDRATDRHALPPCGQKLALPSLAFSVGELW